MTDEHVVIDTAALLDLMIANDIGMILDVRLERCRLHAPSHVDAAVLEGLACLERASVLSAPEALCHIEALAVAPIERHPVQALLEGAWHRRDGLPLNDALYVELARSLGLTLITTDPLLARVCLPVAELIARDTSRPALIRGRLN
jgi:predicted nucleic acid-binding protein